MNDDEIVRELLLDGQDDWVAVHRLVSLVGGRITGPEIRSVRLGFWETSMVSG